MNLVKQVNGAVKALIWKPNRRGWFCDMGILTYRIEENRVRGTFILRSQPFMGGHSFLSEAEAKRAAQNDFNNRVSAQVEPGAWQPIWSAPKDGTRVDLWGVNNLSLLNEAGERITNVSYGRVVDWMGNERQDWQHGRGDDFEPTHWMSVPEGPNR